MKLIRLFVALSLAALCSPARAQKITPPGFICGEIHSGNGMTALDFNSAGRMFVCEKQRRFLVFNPDRKGG